MDVCPGSSAFHDAELARGLLGLIALPRDRKKRRSRSDEQLVADSVRHLHGISGHLLFESRSSFAFSVVSLIVLFFLSAHPRHPGHGRAPEGCGVRQGCPSEEVGGTEERAEEARGLVSASERELASSRAARERAEALLREREAELRHREEEKGTLEEQISSALAKGKRLEVSLAAAADEHATADSRAEMAERRVREAKATVAIAREEVVVAGSRAVLAYKESDDYKGDVGDAMLDVYHKGFAECKEKVLALHSGLDLGGVIPEVGAPGDDEGEGDASEEEGASEGNATGEAAADKGTGEKGVEDAREVIDSVVAELQAATEAQEATSGE